MGNCSAVSKRSEMPVLSSLDNGDPLNVNHDWQFACLYFKQWLCNILWHQWNVHPMSWRGRCRGHSDKWISNTLYAAVMEGCTMFCLWLALPVLCRMKSHHCAKMLKWQRHLRALTRHALAPKPDSAHRAGLRNRWLWPPLPSSSLQAEHLPHLHQAGHLCSAGALISHQCSEPWRVQSTPVESAFTICFLKWLLLSRNSVR